MSQSASASASPSVVGGEALARGSASGPEKNASSPAAPTKLRSCAVCRSRKVRCDKLSPCSNCRRANITCVLPSNDRPPRWARRLDRITNNAVASAKAAQSAEPGMGQVMDRLRSLEGLVKELSGQLEQARASVGSSAGGSSVGNSPDNSLDRHMDDSSPTVTGGVQKQFGRLVLQNDNRSRYLSSGFWSRVNDELDGLEMDQGLVDDASDTSDDESSPGKSPPTQEFDRTPAERHGFIFKHNLSISAGDLRELHPLPSQIPFLVNVYAENVNFVCQFVHIPTITKMVSNLHGRHIATLTPSNEALMFAIYYAAVTSMEEDDVMANFGTSKADLNLKYRLGFEHAMAKADFLNVPNITLVQAYSIFLFLSRRHDSPRFVWMMTGLVIRMGQALGMHRDGTHFENLTPFEIETRRKVWWSLCALDMRASDDQGTDLTIGAGSFDTKVPINLNDSDLTPETKEYPPAREGLADSSVTIVFCEVTELHRRIAFLGKGEVVDTDTQNRLVNGMYDLLHTGYLQYLDGTQNMLGWAYTTIVRTGMAKTRLLIHLPVLFSSPSTHVSSELRNKLLVSAIEVAEFNHAFHSEHAVRHWRWIFQTYTQWHAIVYMSMECGRRPWSPIVERAWVALQSKWLIPDQPNMAKNMQIWFPLRKLMAKASRHREEELKRLRADPIAAAQLEMEDRAIPLPESAGPFPPESSGDLFREMWRKLVAMPEKLVGGLQRVGAAAGEAAAPSILVQTASPSEQNQSIADVHGEHDPWSSAGFAPTSLDSIDQVGLGQMQGLAYDSAPAIPAEWSGGQSVAEGPAPWLWADVDPSSDVFADINMELEADINWYNWVESAKGVELNPESRVQN